MDSNKAITIPMGVHVWLSDKPYPREIVYLGTTLKAIGLGAYPYDCKAKDDYPNAMIYQSETGAWTSLHR